MIFVGSRPTARPPLPYGGAAAVCHARGAGLRAAYGVTAMLVRPLPPDEVFEL